MAKETIPMPELADLSQKLQDYLFQVAMLLNVNFGFSSGDEREKESDEQAVLKTIADDLQNLKEHNKELFNRVRMLEIEVFGR